MVTRPPGRKALARASAHLLIAARSVQLDAHGLPHLKIATLQNHPVHLNALAKLIVNHLTPLDSLCLRACGSNDVILTRAVVRVLGSMPPPPEAPLFSIAWVDDPPPGQTGLSVIDGLVPGTRTPRAMQYLTTWQDVLEVMHLTRYDQIDLRLAVHQALRATLPPVLTPLPLRERVAE